MKGPGPGSGAPAARPVVWLLDGIEAGGAERMALRFARDPARGAPVELVALRRPPGAVAARAALGQAWGEAEIGALGPRLHLPGLRRLADPAGGWRLLRHLRRLRPALLHAHLRYAAIWGALAAALLRVPLVVTVHLGPETETGTADRIKAALERWARRRAARVLYVSAAQREAWRRCRPRQVARERGRVLGHGVETAPAPPAPAARAALRRALGLAPEAVVCVTVAVVRPAKGWRLWLEMIARTAAERPLAQFVWVGGGPDFERLRAAVGAHPCAPRIRLAGPQAAVGPWLAASDLFVFPSEEEAQPTAVLEAMAAGLPVVAASIPAVAEVAGGCGELVAAGEAAALAAAVLRWTRPGPRAAAARARAGRAGRRRIAARYSHAAWHRALEELYAEITAPAPPFRSAPPAHGRVLRPRRTVPL